MVKDGLFNGTPDEKEESARVIILLVQLSPVQVRKQLVYLKSNLSYITVEYEFLDYDIANLQGY